MRSSLLNPYEILLQTEKHILSQFQKHENYLLLLEDNIRNITKTNSKLLYSRDFDLKVHNSTQGGLWGLCLGLVCLRPFLGTLLGTTVGFVYSDYNLVIQTVKKTKTF